ncbi:hypothetical protein ACOMHN_034762 [Nucella lapillus]
MDPPPPPRYEEVVKGGEGPSAPPPPPPRVTPGAPPPPPPQGGPPYPYPTGEQQQGFSGQPAPYGQQPAYPPGGQPGGQPGYPPTSGYGQAGGYSGAQPPPPPQGGAGGGGLQQYTYPPVQASALSPGGYQYNAGSANLSAGYQTTPMAYGNSSLSGPTNQKKKVVHIIICSGVIFMIATVVIYVIVRYS